MLRTSNGVRYAVRQYYSTQYVRTWNFVRSCAVHGNLFIYWQSCESLWDTELITEDTEIARDKDDSESNGGA